MRKYVQQLETCISAKKQKEIYLALKEQLTEASVLLPVLQGPTFVTVAHFEAVTIPTFFFDRFRGCGSWQWEKTVTIEPEVTDFED